MDQANWWFKQFCTPNEAVVTGYSHVGPDAMVIEYSRIDRGDVRRSQVQIDLGALAILSDDTIVIIMADVLQTLRESA